MKFIYSTSLSPWRKSILASANNNRALEKFKFTGIMRTVMKYEDDLYELADEAADEEAEVEVGNEPAAVKKKVSKRPHNYQVRRQLEDFLEERDLKHKVDYFNDLID